MTCLLPLTIALASLAAAVPSPAADSPSATSNKPRRPNIIFILSDDVGLGNLSCFGGDHFKTPQLDALAQSGTRFDRCYSTPLCGPSRCQILTGRYPFRTGMLTNSTGNLIKPVNEIMIPKILKPAGYVTAQVGKWNQLPLEPGDWGFDEYLRFPGSGKYWDIPYTQNGQTKQLAKDKYLPDVMHEFLIDFITRHKSQPFYVHYAMSHIHGKIVRTPDSPAAGSDHYADNVAYMDKLVGKLMADLTRLGLRDKTLVIFVGDNGTARFGVEQATVRGRHLSGQKGTMLEGGSRVPMIASWPGTTPAARVSKDLVDFSDFYATFAELAGARAPQGVTLDSHSFAPQLQGQPGKPREWIYVQLGHRWYTCDGTWKLNQDGELFDMKDAPFVEKPVAADAKDPAAQAARKRLQAVLDKLAPASGKTDIGRSGEDGRKAKAKKARRAKRAAAKV